MARKLPPGKPITDTELDRSLKVSVVVESFRAEVEGVAARFGEHRFHKRAPASHAHPTRGERSSLREAKRRFQRQFVFEALEENRGGDTEDGVDADLRVC